MFLQICNKNIRFILGYVIKIKAVYIIIYCIWIRPLFQEKVYLKFPHKQEIFIVQLDESMNKVKVISIKKFMTY